MIKKENRIVVLGASANPERYSNQAVARLMEKGYDVIPVNPGRPIVHGLPCLAALSDIRDPVDTVTLYVNPEISNKAAEALCALQPRRVIFNPGSENKELEIKLIKQGINTVTACTLVMLRTGQF
ncbi:MAG: hypothetical protein A2293_09505 [Elusimicrobia bacterium RIFOXYB2_FULL_49_7]|nr:MAG: hypothetical protein A2293_09505 [Elusimicrobia bacterium RIFOXYB2_FULL_49_7]